VYTDDWYGLLITVTVPVADRFGWTTFAAMVGKMTSQIVHTKAGAVTTVDTLMMSPSDAAQVGPTITKHRSL